MDSHWNTYIYTQWKVCCLLYAHMPLWRLALAYLGYCVAVPLMTAYCFYCASVEWAGVRYTFRRGKVRALPIPTEQPPALPPHSSRRREHNGLAAERLRHTTPRHATTLH